MVINYLTDQNFKNMSINKQLLLLFLYGVVLSLFSCDYSVDPREANYPDQRIYMPAAYGGGQFVIDNIARRRGDPPFEGHPYRYVVDLSKREFRVPLAVYRAGVDNKGSFMVNININTNIIATINENRVDKYIVLPSDKYSLSTASVEVKNGESNAQFDLIVNLDFLRDNYPGKIFAIGVEVSSTQRERNDNLSVTAVVIHTNMVKPTANFIHSVNTSLPHAISFGNTSLMAGSYRWNFGDGKSSTEASPVHTFPSAGTYNVTLTALGITGEEDKSEKTVAVVVP